MIGQTIATVHFEADPHNYKDRPYGAAVVYHETPVALVVTVSKQTAENLDTLAYLNNGCQQVILQEAVTEYVAKLTADIGRATTIARAVQDIDL